MQASRARLFKEYKEVQREKAVDSDIQLVCDDSNIFKWTALIKGPSETPYEGGVFQLAFSIPEQYPLLPPQVRFLTKIFHPNVHFKVFLGKQYACVFASVHVLLRWPPRLNFGKLMVELSQEWDYGKDKSSEEFVQLHQTASPQTDCLTDLGRSYPIGDQFVLSRKFTGEICLDILKNAWSPAWTLQSVCRAIIALMAHPEPDSPLNCDSGNLLRSGDLRGYQSMARMYTRLAAMPKKG